MIISSHPQRSHGWHNERLGLPTASRFDELITTKGNPTKPERRQKYLYELAGEKETGRPSERYVSWKMKQAIEREPLAKLDYTLYTGNELQEVGLCYKDERKMFGCSPDSLIDPKGGFETKDAEPHVQVERRLNGWNGMDHYQQCQGGMFICDREWWDLQSWCENMEPIIIRFYRDEEFIKKLEKELISFCYDLAAILKKLKGGKR